MMKRLTLLCLLFLAFHENFSQAKPADLKQTLIDFSNRSVQEKIYLHLDKPYYTPSDTIWLKAYTVNAGTHVADSSSLNIYVDLLRKDNGRLFTHQVLKNNNGFSLSYIPLPDSVREGAYEIVAYSQGMRNYSNQNFFRKEVVIQQHQMDRLELTEAEKKSRQEVVDLQFFPEGGNLIAGLQTQVAFKAVNKYGKGVDSVAKIFNSHGDTVATIKPVHLGMGRFIFIPKSGERFYAKVGGKQFSLPEVMEQGYTFYVDNTRSKETIKVIAKNNFPDKDQPILIVHLRGDVVFATQSQTEGNSFSWTLNKMDIPVNGVVHLTLFNKKGEPQCERLVYNDAHAPLKVFLNPEKNEYKPRERVTVDIKVKDFNGAPIKGNFSLSATDSRQVTCPKNGLTIFNYLNMVSDVKSMRDEIKGEIEQPDYYFSSTSMEAAINLDILMMTQGWRRFVWSDILSGKSVDPNFKKEERISISGMTKLANGKPPKVHEVSLFYEEDGVHRILKTSTDETGKFSFENLDVKNGSKIFLKSENKKAKLTLVEPEPVAYQVISNSTPTDSFVEEKIDQLKNDREYWAELESRSKKEKLKVLKEVVVTEKKEKRIDPRRTMYEGMHTTTVAVTSSNCGTASSVLQMLQGRVAGLQIDVQRVSPSSVPTSGGPRTPASPTSLKTGVKPIENTMYDPEPMTNKFIVNVRGPKSVNGADSKVVYLVDGMVMDQNFLNGISPCTIESIDVVTSQVVTLNANAVISVLTKRGNPDYKETPVTESAPNILTTTVKGYQVSREFYSPNYSLVKEVDEKKLTDFRSTLYWNPNIETDVNGKARVTFWNSDEKTSVHVILEGLSNNGQPVFATVDYQVE